VKTDDRLVHLDVTQRAFGIAEVQLLHPCGVGSGATTRTGDRGAPVDVIAKILGVAEVQIVHQS
jgi:hypothetical protein